MVALVLGLAAYAVATQPHTQQRSHSETSLSAAELYDRLREGTGFTGLLAAKTSVDALSILYAERVRQIESLRTRMAESWTGGASDVALQYSQPFSDAMRDSGDALTAIAGPNGPLARQVDAYQQVLRDVQKLPATPPESDLLNTLNPFETDTDRAINEYNDKATRNIAAYTAYYTASGDNGYAMPQQFPTPVDTTVPSVSVLPQTGPPAASPQFSGQVPVPGGSVGPSLVPPPAAAVGGPSAGEPAGTGLTTGQSFSPTPAAGAASVPTPVAGAPQSPAGGTGVPFGIAPGVGSGRPGGGGSGAGRPGVSTGRPGSGSGGPGAGARGPGGMAEQLSRKGAPGMSSVERAVLPAERASTTGVGPAAGRQQKDGEEDKERSSKYVLGEDLDLGITGTIAPPVIGDNR